MEAVGQIIQQDRRVGTDGKLYRSTAKPLKAVARSPVERKGRIEAVTLIHGDCRKELKKIASHSVDAFITDPIYPEVNREYGRVTEDQWHDHDADRSSRKCRRVLKPKGSAVFILQPNYEKLGQMRLWLWEFLALGGEGMELDPGRVLVVD